MPEQKDKIGCARLPPLNRHLAKMAHHVESDWPLCRWPLAAEKLPTHQNEDDAASAAEFSF